MVGSVHVVNRFKDALFGSKVDLTDRITLGLVAAAFDGSGQNRQLLSSRSCAIPVPPVHVGYRSRSLS